MSIEYFVEGDIREHFNGDIKVYTKGNIVYSSQKSVQMSSETGITYGTPSKINKNDSPANEIDVVLNLFFDGTGNNKSNTEARKLGTKSYHKYSDKKEDSYENDFSNIAKGYDSIDSNADRQVTEYIEGIGTENLASDDDFYGKGLGMGDTGIMGKVTKGCRMGAKKLTKFAKKDINILKVNVFGFSRGAAAARFFLHVASTQPKIYYGEYSQENPILYVSAPKNIPNSTLIIKDKDKTKLPFILKYGYFGACLMKMEYKIKRIVFNFVGLYDTVASYGLKHSNDTEDLNLNAVSKARFVLQIASVDEYRKNFRLTNIKSAGLRGLEFTLPGVHSDIGGGYRNNVREDVLIYKGSKENCEKYKKILVEEGWYKDDKKEIEIREITVNEDEYPIRKCYLIGKRVLSNHYDKVSLNTMFHYSKQFGVIYDKRKIEKNYSIEDVQLTKIYNQLVSYMNACNKKRNGYIDKLFNGDYLKDIKNIHYQSFISKEDLSYLRNHYLHWSVRYGDFVHGENVSGVLLQTQRKRMIQNG